MQKRTFVITQYGAIPNLSTIQTKEIQAAIDACFLHGGGTVEIPEGKYLIGSIRLRSNVELHLLKNAVLQGSRDPKDYFGYLEDDVEPLSEDLITDCLWNRAENSLNKDRDYRFMRIPGSRWNNAIIRAIMAENVSIIGEEGALIDGSDCYDEWGEENYRGPHAIGMYYCKNIHFKGYCVKDSANWAHSLFYCGNILAENVTVLAGHDGFHVTVCNNIRIEDSVFRTGDDCIAGFSNVNVTVRNCELNSSCSALRFGGTNVVVENCRMYGPGKYLFRGSLTQEEKKTGVLSSPEGHRNNMLSAFTYYSDYSVPIELQPGNILIKNCKIDNADRFLHYNYSGNEMWQRNRPLESITFEDVEATNLRMPLTAYGDKDVRLRIKLNNVSVSFRNGFEAIDFIHACNYETIDIENVKLMNHRGNVIIRTWSEGNVTISNLICGCSKKSYVVKATEEFFATPI